MLFPFRPLKKTQHNIIRVLYSLCPVGMAGVHCLKPTGTIVFVVLWTGRGGVASLLGLSSIAHITS